jgi:hypothetical protein
LDDNREAIPLYLAYLRVLLGFSAASVRADLINFDPDGTNNPNGTGSLSATTSVASLVGLGLAGLFYTVRPRLKKSA